jgi:hypothetical protein
LARLGHAAAVTVLPDGGHHSRSPQAALELLLDLLTLDDVLLQRGREVPAPISRAADRLGAAVRFFTLGDGRLACFQGGEACDRVKVEAARVHEDAEYRPFGFAPHSRFQRLSGRDIQALIDAGSPAPGPWSLAACAQPLAIEITAGRDRLITNGGWSPEASGPQALRMTAAGSTLCLGEASTGELLNTWAARTLGPRLIGGPEQVTSRRNEAAGGTWIELSHDGWVREFGLVHERRLFMDAATDELRGEDRLLPSRAPRRRRSLRGPLPPAHGRGGLLLERRALHSARRPLGPRLVVPQRRAGGHARALGPLRRRPAPAHPADRAARDRPRRRRGACALEGFAGRGSARAVTRRTLAFNSSPGLIFAHDLAMAAVAMAATLTARYAVEGKPVPEGVLPTSVIFFTVICALVFPLSGLHRALWRYTALNDLWRVFRAAVLVNLTLLPFLFAWNRLEGFPRSTPFLATALLTVLLSFGRVLAQVMASRSPRSSSGWRTADARRRWWWATPARRATSSASFGAAPSARPRSPASSPLKRAATAAPCAASRCWARSATSPPSSRRSPPATAARRRWSSPTRGPAAPSSRPSSRPPERPAPRWSAPAPPAARRC